MVRVRVKGGYGEKFGSREGREWGSGMAAELKAALARRLQGGFGGRKWS